MVRYFQKYTVEIVNKPFVVNQLEFFETAIISFYDEKNSIIETKNLAFPSIKFINENFNLNSKINISECYINNENFETLKQNCNQNDEIIFDEFYAENSFFDFQNQELDFSNITFTENFNLKKAIIIASKINFSNSNFKTKNTDFSYTLFKSEEFTINNSKFSKGDISFKNTIFSNSKKFFKNLNFKNGTKNFENIEFGEGDIDFQETNFGKGKVSFKISNFGNGNKNFSEVNFGSEETSFDKANFGNGDVSFRNSIFIDSKVNFISAIFLNGKKDFSGTNFGEGDIIFKSCNFGNGKISFRQCTFGNGMVDFHFGEFGIGDKIFDLSKFNNGGIDFSGVNFGKGKISFNKAFLGNGNINFEASSLEGNFIMQNSVFGRGEFNFENANYINAEVEISNVEFGLGKVSFKNSKFKILSLKESQLDNFFDLRIAECKKLDLSETVVKDILDINPQKNKIGFEEINLSGMRLLGRIYLDWQSNDVKRIIYSQKTSYLDKSEQFRILKENYNQNGQYNYEDKAYVEFKRCESKAELEIERQRTSFYNIIPFIKYYFKWLIFDKMGKFATDPLRVLVTMGITYILFSLLYLLIGSLGNIHIVSSLFLPDDPRVLNPVGKAFYHSAITFLTIGYGDYYPDGIARWISATEGFVGLFQMSYFTVAFVRKVLR